ncbi:MAG: LytS/YehU family sensor histidine kinase [Patiriisocius sp.]|jgi:LytS/YehU family sensor histidine kinase
MRENHLSKFSKLIRLFFEYSRRREITLNEEILLLNHYLEIEKMRFEDKLSFEIMVVTIMDIEDYKIPTMILQPIVENAVNHGIFHKISNGNILIEFKELQNKNAYSVLIQDDGIGINKAKGIYKNPSKNYQSKSSVVLAERLAMLQQSSDWNITYSIKDLGDSATKTGTEVLLTFQKQSYD